MRVENNQVETPFQKTAAATSRATPLVVPVLRENGVVIERDRRRVQSSQVFYLTNTLRGTFLVMTDDGSAWQFIFGNAKWICSRPDKQQERITLSRHSVLPTAFHQKRHGRR